MAGAGVAIVTGGAQGLGAEISKVLLKEGYKVCITDIQSEKGSQFVKKLNEAFGAGRAHFVVCDVSNADHYRQAFEKTEKELGKVTLLVNNAGILDEKNPEKMLQVNLMGSVIACQMALRFMGTSNGGKGGTVLLVASLAGLIYHSALPVYAASKHGVVGLTRSYGTHYHLEKNGVVFQALCPSIIDTAIMPRWATHSAIDGYDVTDHPGVMKPEYVAQAVLKLLQDGINGSTLLVSKEQGNFYVDVPASVKPFLFN